MCGRCGAVGRLRYLGRFDKDGTPAKRVPWPGLPHPPSDHNSSDAVLVELWPRR